MKKIVLAIALTLPLPAFAQSQALSNLDQDLGAMLANQQAANRAGIHVLDGWKAVVMENGQLRGELAKAQARVKELEDKYEKGPKPPSDKKN